MRKFQFEIIALLSILVMATFLLIGSSESRLANSNGDDHPVVWARYFTQPENWINDGNFFAAKAFGRASLPNLLAILGAKVHESVPYLLTWIYVLVQNVGIGLAFYLLATCFTRNKWDAVIIALLSFSMNPWQLNLAYYPNMMHSPYPGHLVMPFIVLGAYFIFRNQVAKSAAVLSIAGLIHPSQTIQFTFLVTIFLFLSCSEKKTLKKVLLFALPVISSLAVPLLLVPHFENPLTDSELLPSALLNPHLVPWNSTTFWPWGVPSIIAAFVLSSLECLPFSKKLTKLGAFWWANFVALFVFGSLHVIGAKLRILPIIAFCPFRISVINSVLLAPVGFSYLLKKIKQGTIGSVWTASSLIMFLLISKGGFFWGLLLILFVGENLVNKAAFKKVSALLVLLWWILYLGAGRPLRNLLGPDLSSFLRLILSPGYSLTISKIITILILGLFLAGVCRVFNTSRKWATSIIFLFATVFTLIQSYQLGQESLKGQLKSIWEMQKWANQITPRDSVFLMEAGSWRGVSDRQVQVVGYRKNQILAYFRYREAKGAEEKLQRLYDQFGTKNYNELSDSAFLTFAKEFKGSHLIENSHLPRRSFKMAYQNSDWRIYELPKVN